jgi:hypothetical protein
MGATVHLAPAVHPALGGHAVRETGELGPERVRAN